MGKEVVSEYEFVQAGEQYHIKRIKDFIKLEMDKYYEGSEIPKPDTNDFYDSIDEVWKMVDKQKKKGYSNRHNSKN